MNDPETPDECLDVMATEYEWMTDVVRAELKRLRAALHQARCHEDCGGQGELLADSMTGYEECLRCSLLHPDCGGT